MRERLAALRDDLYESRVTLHLHPDRVHRVVRIALALAREPALTPGAEPGTWVVPSLTGSWSRATIGLEHPATPDVRRPITFDHDVARDRTDVVLAHLGHRLVRMALALMRAEVWGTGNHLHRVAIRYADARLGSLVAVAHGRLVITGAAGHRLLLEHRDARLRPADRLRYRSMTGKGRRPEGTDPSTRLRALPLALWPDWSIRLRPPTIDPNSFRIAAAIALCVPGATTPIRSIRDRWPGPCFTQRMGRFGTLVTADPHSTAILGALCALTEHLDRHGAPIDYDRRRTLASQIELLDVDAWTIMCRAGAHPPARAASSPKHACGYGRR
jgi:hypothetical protein